MKKIILVLVFALAFVFVKPAESFDCNNGGGLLSGEAAAYANSACERVDFERFPYLR